MGRWINYSEIKLLAPVTNLKTKQRNATFHAFHIITHSTPTGINIEDFIWNTLTNPNNFDSNGISLLTTKHQSTGFAIELREFSEDGKFAIGCLARCREDSPPVRKPDKSEVLRPLLSGHTYLEKNYFLYSKEDRVLLWQFNMSANHYSTFASMLNVLSGGQAAFICVPNINPTKVDFNNIEIEYIDFKLSMPRTKKQRRQVIDSSPLNWGIFNPFKLMEDMGMQSYSGKFSASRNRSLAEKSLDFAANLSSQNTLRKLKLKLEDCDEPIDVLASRFRATEPVNYHEGQHLDNTSMFDALKRVWEKYEQQAAQT